MGNSEDTSRAEFPPARYWQRWCADAEPPQLPGSPVRSEPAPSPSTRPPAPAESGEPPYRVLVVEDDRSQALFAETVLNGAGMQARAESNSENVLSALEEFRPDLVLMDLHMPAIDGAELTNMIRARKHLAHIPVVFLTGDLDPERQFEVIRLGADDFLTKPVRPRHLITTVENRIKRSRQLQARDNSNSADPATGLFPRSRMLQRLATVIPGVTGALHFVEVQNVSALRNRLGYGTLDTLLLEVGRKIAALAGGHATAQLNDGTFLVHVNSDVDDVAEFARQLRIGLALHTFVSGGEALHLRASIGSARISPVFDNAGSAMAAAEQALGTARDQPDGIWVHVPPAAGNNTPGGLTEQVTTAISRRRLELAFQPIVAVAGNNEAQYQTLLRMRDSEGVLHPAGTILPLAENAGLMHEIDRQILQMALGVLAQHREKAPIRLYVSQSPRSLSRDGYAQWLLDTLGSMQIDGRNLVIDIRQDEALTHANSLQEFGSKMVPAGIQLCLSHYTPKEEADALIAQLPLSYVRLAPDFSNRLGDSQVRDLMRESIERAHRLGLQVIGQQVEDPQAAATLWMSGIDYIQGHLVQQAAEELNFDFHHSVL